MPLIDCKTVVFFCEREWRSQYCTIRSHGKEWIMLGRKLGAEKKLLNKGKSGWTGTSFFVLEVPLCYLRLSIIYSLPCDGIVQRAYSRRVSKRRGRMGSLHAHTCEAHVHALHTRGNRSSGASRLPGTVRKKKRLYCSPRQYLILALKKTSSASWNIGQQILPSQGSKFIFGFGSTCSTRGKFLGALPKF